jgi:putative FmdB family regulatory protein
MYVVFDYVCTKCEHTEEAMVPRHKMDDQYCPLCGHKMVRLPAGTRTHFRFADPKLKP